MSRQNRLSLLRLRVERCGYTAGQVPVRKSFVVVSTSATKFLRRAEGSTLMPLLASFAMGHASRMTTTMQW